MDKEDKPKFQQGDLVRAYYKPDGSLSSIVISRMMPMDREAYVAKNGIIISLNPIMVNPRQLFMLRQVHRVHRGTSSFEEIHSKLSALKEWSNHKIDALHPGGDFLYEVKWSDHDYTELVGENSLELISKV